MMVGKRVAIWSGVATWLVVILAALVTIGSERLMPFDPNGTLTAQMIQPDFDSRLSLSLGRAHSKTVVHFTQPLCYCNMVANPHINSVKRLAEKEGFDNTVISIDSDPKWASVVPSTPAIAVFDENGKLDYLGPYSTGFYCSPSNGLVEAFIEQRTKPLPGAVIAAEAEGCYCPT